MKLLFDENLSPRLVAGLADLFPGSAHVSERGRRGLSDTEIWSLAADEGFVIVTKHDDFEHLALVRGAPPKVVWLRAGNVSTAAILAQLRAAADRLQAFAQTAEESLLVL